MEEKTEESRAGEREHASDGCVVGVREQESWTLFLAEKETEFVPTLWRHIMSPGKCFLHGTELEIEVFMFRV